MAVTTVRTPARHGRSSVAGRGDHRTRYFNWFCASVLLVFAAIWLVPLLWAIDTSVRPEAEITTNPISWWTSHWNIDNYRQVINATDLPSWYVNSIITSGLSSAFTVVVCSMAGFAISRTQFRAKRIVLGLILAGLLIPAQVLILPLFREFNSMKLLNTYWAIVLPAIATPIAVFVFASFFDGLPKDLVESARLDGAGWFRIYSRIFMPLCKPAISAVTIFTFVWTWNQLLWPLLVLSSTKLMTIPVGLASVQSAYGIIYGQVMASAVLGALPLILVFLLFQRRIVEGIANTGIK